MAGEPGGGTGRRESEMALDWDEVRARYDGGGTVPSLTGGSTVEVTGVSEDRIFLRHSLWGDSLSRRELETALDLLDGGSVPSDPIGFAEGFRRYYFEGPEVNPGCSRVPNMAALILKDLGYFNG